MTVHHITDKDGNALDYSRANCPPIDMFLDYEEEANTGERGENLSPAAAENAKLAEKQARDQGIDPSIQPVIVDVEASKCKMTWRNGICPCLTRSRHRGHWISNLRRRVSLDGMARLQGM